MNDEPETIPINDAKDDIEEEYGGDLTPAYFGSALVWNYYEDDHDTTNLLVVDADSYEEAVGRAVLEVVNAYPPDEGWVIKRLNLETEHIWVETGSDIEEFVRGPLDGEEEAAAVEGAIDSTGVREEEEPFPLDDH